jgi:hypothetical protein
VILHDYLTLLANAATALGVAVGAWQLRTTGRLANTQFEDGLTKEYREIIQQLPVDALLGNDVPEQVIEKYLHHFYRYVDLTNQQLFLRQTKRIGTRTWRNWKDGIADVMRLPAFAKAWERLKAGPADRFTELRLFEQDAFASDPRKWPRHRALANGPAAIAVPRTFSRSA